MLGETLSMQTAGLLVGARLRRISQQINIATEDELSVIDAAWKAQVLDVIDQIGDRDFQLRSWTGIGPEVSSFEESISQLMDDQSFADFCEHLEDVNLRRKCRELLSAVNDLDGSLQKLPPMEIIDEPSWMSVRDLASGVLDAFRSSDGKIKGVS